MNETSSLGLTEDKLVYYSSLFLTILSSIALVVNAYLLNCSRFLRRPIGVNLRLCVTLTAADALCALFYILTYTVNVLTQPNNVSNCWLLLIEVFKLATFFASVFTLLALALNHYVGIVYPLRRHAITPKTVKMAIALSFLLPLISFVTVFSVHPGGFRADVAFGFFNEKGCQVLTALQDPLIRWIQVVPFIFVVLLLSFLYIHIMLHMSKIAKDPLLTINNNHRFRRSTNRKLLVTLMLLAGSACIGWLPTTITHVLTCHTCLFALPRNYASYLAIFSQALNILKLIADAFIYASRLIEIRYSIWAFNQALRGKFPMPGVPAVRSSEHNVPSEFSRYVTDTKENKKERQQLAALDGPIRNCYLQKIRYARPFIQSNSTRSMKILRPPPYHQHHHQSGAQTK
ncbi:unnamed protein product, partial [Mesorhabditis belari]|uniref:G-protein coupled receptors family 1 profile domain-containing protein n=1 Tax=Mesorhabditis belari TaxID=2138241 RepID=A0AAF3FL39_9BILA